MKNKPLIILPAIFLISLLIILFISGYQTDKTKKRYIRNISIDNLSADKKTTTAKEYLKLINATSNRDSIIEAAIYLGNYYQYKYDYQKSLNYYLKAYEVAFNEKTSVEIADISYKIAGIYLDLGDYIKAYEFALRADSIERNNNLKSAETLNLMGSIYEKTGLYVKSLAIHFESLELQKESKTLPGIANSYHNLAHVYLLGERYDKALNYYIKALEIYQQLMAADTNSRDNALSSAKIRLSFGNYYMIQNDSATALSQINMALKLFEKLNAKTYIAQALFLKANIYFQWKELRRAGDYYSYALDIYRQENNKIGQLVTNLNLARIAYQNTDEAAAIATLKSCITQADSIGAKIQHAEAAEALYYIYSGLGDSLIQTNKYAAMYLKSKKYLAGETIQDSIIQMSVKHEVTLQKNEEIADGKSAQNARTAILLSIFGIVIISTVFIYFYDRTSQLRKFEKKLAEEQLARFKDVVDAIENERKRIAIDLHDSLGQMLSTTKLYLSGLEDLLEQQSENNKNLYSNTINLLDESCGELRNISYNIMPGSFIKYGLKVAIEELINKMEGSNKIRIEFECTGLDKSLGENFEITIYRIIQETFNNIVKHANATIVQLRLNGLNGALGLSIADNGKGMEDIEMYKGKGLGWKSIFSRVQMLDGQIDVDTAINKGTKINILLPVK